MGHAEPEGSHQPCRSRQATQMIVYDSSALTSLYTLILQLTNSHKDLIGGI